MLDLDHLETLTALGKLETEVAALRAYRAEVEGSAPIVQALLDSGEAAYGEVAGLEEQNSMVIPSPTDPFYQPEPEERVVDMPIAYEDALRMIAKEASESEAVWVKMDEHVESVVGKHWVIVSASPTKDGVRITVQEEQCLEA